MTTKLIRRALAAAVVLCALAALPATPAGAQPRLTCRASMSFYHPRDYTSDYVFVRTAPFARVTTAARYKTVTTVHHGRAGLRGNLQVRYYISGATPGYTVKVIVTVDSGGAHGSCSTWFTPVLDPHI